MARPPVGSRSRSGDRSRGHFHHPPYRRHDRQVEGRRLHPPWLAAGRDWFYLYPPVKPGDSCLHLAISHGSGYLFTPIWLAGGRNVMAEKFDPATLLDVMEHERTAYIFMVPTILNAVNRIPGIERRTFPHLKCMLVSAAPISDETALKAYEIFGDAMYQGYGQPEVLPIAMMGPRQWFARNVPGVAAA